MFMFYIVALIIFVIGLVQHAQRNRRKVKNIVVYFVAPIPVIMSIVYAFPYFTYANDSFVQASDLVAGTSKIVYQMSFIGGIVILGLMFIIAKIADGRVEAKKETV